MVAAAGVDMAEEAGSQAFAAGHSHQAAGLESVSSSFQCSSPVAGAVASMY